MPHPNTAGGDFASYQGSGFSPANKTAAVRFGAHGAQLLESCAENIHLIGGIKLRSITQPAEVRLIQI